MCLGANEEAAPKVITDATASVNQQVIAADVGNTTCWVSTNPVGVVEAYALDAGACHQLGTDLLAEPGRDKSVEVVQNGSEWLVVVVQSLFGSDRDFSAEAEAVFENHVGTEAGIHSALFRRRQISLRRAAVGGRKQGTRTKGNVNLLSRSESCKQKNGAPACDQRELSQ